MKLSVLILFSVLAFSAFAQPRSAATLSWDYPTNELASVRFNLYSSTNVALPVSTWPLLTNVSGTNVVVQINPGQCFYFCTASNEFGESIPSNVATATVARTVGNLKIK